MRTRAGVLVGREAELATTLREVRNSARGSGGPARFWIGEPGVGKSRLLAEVAERAGADGLVVLRGRASALGPVSPLRPFAEALASLQRRGLLPDDQLGGYRAVLGRVLPQLAGPGVAGVDAPPIPVFAEAVLRLLTVLGGERAGCLLLLEDVHDADPESLAVLEYLLDNITGAPVALLGALRNEPCGARDLLTAAELRGTAQLQPIRSLDQPATTALIAACLPGDRPSTQLAELIWRNSGGNPLMVEELLHDLIDTGQLSRQDGNLRLPADPVLAPPPSMLQLIGHRMGRLGEVVRRVLVAAAVYGEHFPVATLATAVGAGDSELWDAIQVGLAQQLIVADGPGWYRFHHPLTHAAVLEVAGEAERRHAAARLAEAVLAEDPEQAAATCRLAGRLLAEAGKPAAAGRLYERSGRAALRDNAVEWAVADLGEALRLAPTRLELIGELILALTKASQLDRALELVDQLGPPGDGASAAAWVRIHLDLTRGCYGAGRMEQAGVQLARARALAAGDELLRYHCDAVAAPAMIFGRTEEADSAGERLARTVAEAAGRLARTAADTTRQQEAAEVACCAWQALVFALGSQERFQELDAHLQRIAALAERYRLPGWALFVRGMDATARLWGDGDDLPARLMREDAQRLGAIGHAVGLEGDLLLHELMVGDGSLAPARAALTQHAEQAQRMGNLARCSFAVSALLLAAGLRADRAALAELLARYQSVLSADSLWLEVDLEAAQGLCLALEGRDEAALTALLGHARRRRMGPNDSSFLRGPLILLSTLAGTASPDQLAQALHPGGRGRWNRQFLHWAAAVHAGRSGDVALAASHARQAARAAEIYPVPRHLAARLVAPAAAAAGWGNPIEDVRAAEAWFHQNGVPVAARSCRNVLRTLGAPVRYRRAGGDPVPSPYRAAGVTAREYEICLLVLEHLDNRAIGQRLHISHRTVENHIATLLAKFAVPNRRALIDRITAAGGTSSPAAPGSPVEPPDQ